MRIFARTAAAASLTTAMLVLTMPGSATAATTAEAVGGPEQIRVSVTSDEKHWVGHVYLDGKIQNFVLAAGGEGSVGPSTVITGVAPGTHRVLIYVGINGDFGHTMFDRDIEVTKAG